MESAKGAAKEPLPAHLLEVEDEPCFEKLRIEQLL